LQFTTRDRRGGSIFFLLRFPAAHLAVVPQLNAHSRVSFHELEEQLASLRDLRLEYDPRDLGRDVNGADDVTFGGDERRYGTDATLLPQRH
jgi:hypothetical protein